MDRKDIHPSLRTAGMILSHMPYADRNAISRMNRMMEKTVKGKWLSRVSVMHEEYLERDDGSRMRLCIAQNPDSAGNDRTGILWIHGGGFAIGLPEQDVGFADVFLKTKQAVVILPQYRKSDEAPYPAALSDCYLALLWMAANAKKLGIRPDQIFVGGESAGGSLAAAVCMLARDRGEVSVAFQMPLYPMLDDRPTVTNADNDAPVWDSRRNREAWQMYTGSRKNIPYYCAPARCTDYSLLPPAFTYVGDIEPFYDETMAFVRNLYEADVPVMHKVYPGCFHGFDIICPDASVSREARSLLRKVFLYARENFFARDTKTFEGIQMLRSLIDQSVQDELAALDALLEELPKNA